MNKIYEKLEILRPKPSEYWQTHSSNRLSQDQTKKNDKNDFSN
jgi:hypothetical protein